MKALAISFLLIARSKCNESEIRNVKGNSKLLESVYRCWLVEIPRCDRSVQEGNDRPRVRITSSE